MLTYEENVKAILETHFAGFKEELIDSARERILSLKTQEESMTREEAIEILKDLWRYEHSEFSEKSIREALDTAIIALEQGPIINKIKAEIEKQEMWLMSAGYNAYNIDIAFNSIKSVLAESALEKAYQEGYYDGMEQASRALKTSEFLRACSESEE